MIRPFEVVEKEKEMKGLSCPDSASKCSGKHQLVLLVCEMKVIKWYLQSSSWILDSGFNVKQQKHYSSYISSLHAALLLLISSHRQQSLSSRHHESKCLYWVFEVVVYHRPSLNSLESFLYGTTSLLPCLVTFLQLPTNHLVIDSTVAGMRVNIMRISLIAMVSALTIVTVSSYKLPPLSRSSVTHRSADFPDSQSSKETQRSLCSRERQVSLSSSVEDYGPQFASYLQNDVSVFTLGNQHFYSY